MQFGQLYRLNREVYEFVHLAPQKHAVQLG